MEKITYIYIKRCFVLLLVITLVSCNKDFLELTPKDQATDGTVFATSGNADLFLNDIYSTVSIIQANVGTGSPARNEDPEDNRTDDGMGKPSNNSMTVYKKANYTPASANPPTHWAQYTNIRKANLFIEKLTASALPADFKKLRLAEARFLRAYFYYLLWTHHGGVPVITDVLNITEQGDAVFRARNTDQETFKFITDELAAVAPDLPNVQGKSRATRGAALTLKGFCELFNASALKNTTNDKAKWALAAATYKQVMDLNIYALYPDYEKLFFEEGEYSNEVIFDRSHVAGITTLSNSKAGYQGPNMSAGGLELSWCGVAITQDMVDQYQMANGKDITDPTSGYDPQNPYVGREKRFYQSIVYDGSTWVGELMVIRRGLASPNEVDLGSAGDHTDTGYYLRKGLEQKYAVSGPNHLSGANAIIFRFGEVLLSYAEAQNEAIGPDASVYTAINRVRARSDLAAVPPGLNQAQMRDVIRHERRVELFWEEKRWYDLIRWKTAETVLNGTSRGMRIDRINGVWTYATFNAVQGKMTFVASKNYLFPIPQAAIDRNKNLTQNPGY